VGPEAGAGHRAPVVIAIGPAIPEFDREGTFAGRSILDVLKG
jgi:hypothetical protein